MRRERQTAELAGHGVVTPQELQAYLLEEGAELSHQHQQNLRALAAGEIALPSVKAGLRALGAEGEEILKAARASWNARRSPS
eukprot:6483441-Alexandrium_andersonii.AAC.1